MQFAELELCGNIFHWPVLCVLVLLYQMNLTMYAMEKDIMHRVSLIFIS